MPISIADIKAANKAAGDSPVTLSFFNCGVLPTVYEGRYFITSERFSEVEQ